MVDEAFLLSGKTLGGSSSISQALYTRGLAAQYDAWSDLLEASDSSVGWNWASLLKYMQKVCNKNLHRLVN